MATIIKKCSSGIIIPMYDAVPVDLTNYVDGKTRLQSILSSDGNLSDISGLDYPEVTFDEKGYPVDSCPDPEEVEAQKLEAERRVKEDAEAHERARKADREAYIKAYSKRLKKLGFDDVSIEKIISSEEE